MNEECKIKGWAARDTYCSDEQTNLYFGYKKPRRIQDISCVSWCGFGDFIGLPQWMFPELKPTDEPIEVELTIKKL